MTLSSPPAGPGVSEPGAGDPEPGGEPRLLAVSDLHVGYQENRAIADRLQPVTAADWLIVAGDVGEQAGDVEAVLAALTERFALVIWVPGNHELWTHRRDPLRLRGEERYQHLVQACRRLGVLTPEDAYPVWPGAGGPVVIVPLFLLYDYSFRPDGADTAADGLELAHAAGIVSSDERMLHPDPYPSRAAWCADRLAISGRRLRGVAGRSADGAGQPLSAGAGADQGDAVSGVRAVVRDRADRRLAGAVRRRGGRLRPPAYPPDYLARRHPARGGVAWLPARVEAPAPLAGHPPADPAVTGRPFPRRVRQDQARQDPARRIRPGRIRPAPVRPGGIRLSCLLRGLDLNLQPLPERRAERRLHPLR